MLAGEHPAGPAESRGYFVADEQHIELIRKPSNLLEESRGLDQHPGGALNDRLDADRGDVIGSRFKEGLQAPNPLTPTLSRREKEMHSGPLSLRERVGACARHGRK